MTFGFLIPVYQEPQKQIDACIASVKKHYPDIPIILISDGGPERTVQGCGYIQGEHLKELKHGGAWVQRLFQVGLTLNTDKIIKIDPDTRILRPFKEIPNADFFGEIQVKHPFIISIIRGGCKGYSKQIIQRALTEKWFQDPYYTDPIFTYKRKKEINLSEDQVTSWAMFSHGVPFTNWPEISNENKDGYSTKHYVYEV